MWRMLIEFLHSGQFDFLYFDQVVFHISVTFCTSHNYACTFYFTEEEGDGKCHIEECQIHRRTEREVDEGGPK